MRDGEETREKETAREGGKTRGEQESREMGIGRTGGGGELLCCGRIRRECDRAKERNLTE